MWKKYFHPKSRIIGIDLNPNSKSYEKYGFEIFIGDQEDNSFWKKFYKKVGKIDILLDDGGQNGLIVIEDIHTSYFTEFGNPSKISFVNYTKKIIDLINSRYSSLNKNVNNNNQIYKLLKKNIFSVVFYESVIAFRINPAKSIISKPIWNRKKIKKIDDYRYRTNTNSLWELILFFKKFLPRFFVNIKIVKYFSSGIIKFLINRKKIKKYKKYLF